MIAREINFDGIVGPTHNYAGLSPGNVASQSNAGGVSRPRSAVLQGLAKAKGLADLGLAQHVLPPLARPDLGWLRSLGFAGDDGAVVAAASAAAPHLLAAASSASAMWAANTATVCPSVDSGDGRVHLTPANLAYNLHRSIEPAQMVRVLRGIFADDGRFAVHDALPATPRLFDEGAANHTRLCASHDGAGLHVFCYGRPAGATTDESCGTRVFSARQSEDASVAVARRHGVPERAVFVRQNPAAIDAGVFHNDVISVGNGNVLLLHDQAFADTEAEIEKIGEAFGEVVGGELAVFRVSNDELTVAEAVGTYLFNSQLVTMPDGSMLLVAPIEVEAHDRARGVADRLVAEVDAVRAVRYVDVRESMRNGGGPACLRLRVVLTGEERSSLSGRTLLDEELYGELTAWAERHYREELSPADLADPGLVRESRDALDALSGILGLPGIYAFQW